MVYTREQLEYLKEFDRMSHLREMRHSQGWEILCQIASQRIEQVMDSYIRDDLKQEEILMRHQQLKAIKMFWLMLKEVVENAVNFSDPAEVAVALYSLSQDPDLG